MIFILVLVLIGLIKKQRAAYWYHACAAVFVQVIVSVLCRGGGTLQDPSGDGPIAHLVRVAVNDGPLIGVFAILVIALGWALPIWIVRRGYVGPSNPPTVASVSDDGKEDRSH